MQEQIPLIMEGDFISVDLAAAYQDNEVKSLFIYEGQKDQIIENYRQREGGSAQTFRASISLAYGKALRQACLAYGIEVIEARPFETLLKRVMEKLDE
ncbi:hypothetical protein EZV73_00395 [Acidaminobacter sp. JC074]|uniref:hypothetical protein n=1 Tax=Acidaminobacter sp. JC074 TaxID=2530199 RepID=UPI001F0FDC60|nr:hypothetical protein [Acidaminobacter sp. JC074]MCH4885998.1 hypothetical protein [Acidaminobacter sp. JC074]